MNLKYNNPVNFVVQHFNKNLKNKDLVESKTGISQ